MADDIRHIDRDALLDALTHAHHPTLSLVYLHLTGDDRFLSEAYQPLYEPFSDDPDGGLSTDQKAEIRHAVADAYMRFLETGDPGPTPDNVLLNRMMNYAVTDTIPEEYTEFLAHELPLDGVDRRMPGTGIDFSEDWAQNHKVTIIGAGMSGLLAGIVLKGKGIPFEIIEKNSDVGGTWLENTYPGCRVDSQNHLYCYSFASNFDWPHHFSTQAHLLRYFQKIADDYGLRDYIRFNTYVEKIQWDDQSQTWTVTVKDQNGKIEEKVSKGVISAVGQLNNPALPDIDGRDSFKGPSFHSARWDHSVDLSGKHVGVIGTGASAFQFIPEIAKTVGEMRVFQRTPGWLVPTPEYHDPLTTQKRFLLEKLPFYQTWYRFYLFILMGDAPLGLLAKDPEWNEQDYAPNADAAMVRKMVEEYIAAQADGDETLKSAIVPDFHLSGKRSLRDNGVWVNALKRENVALDTGSIQKITETGVTMQDGTHHEFDVLIYGTGFKAQDFLSTLSVTGRHGKDLHETWDGDARAYKGVTVSGFPNLYLMYGPNTNIVVNGSIIFFSESEVHYMCELMKFMENNGVHAADVTEEALANYNEVIDAANAQMPWGYAKANTWYRNKKGRSGTNWPLRLIDFWNQSRMINPEAYELIS